MEANPFHDERLAAVFDAVGSDPARLDLDPYVAIVDELGAHTIIDLGSGTGTFACRLADPGKRVIGVEPGQASMNLAQRRPDADRVRWVLGDAEAMPACDADLVTMTGNIPEHMTDDAWAKTLTASHRALRSGGHIVFGNRNVETQTWLTSPEFAPRSAPGSQNRGMRVDSTAAGPVHHWLEVTDLTPDAFTFRWTFLLETTGEELTWETAFRVRSVDQRPLCPVEVVLPHDSLGTRREVVTVPAVRFAVPPPPEGVALLSVARSADDEKGRESVVTSSSLDLIEQGPPGTRPSVHAADVGGHDLDGRLAWDDQFRRDVGPLKPAHADDPVALGDDELGVRLRSAQGGFDALKVCLDISRQRPGGDGVGQPLIEDRADRGDVGPGHGANREGGLRHERIVPTPSGWDHLQTRTCRPLTIRPTG